MMVGMGVGVAVAVGVTVGAGVSVGVSVALGGGSAVGVMGSACATGAAQPTSTCNNNTMMPHTVLTLSDVAPFIIDKVYSILEGNQKGVFQPVRSQLK